jgi:hypothetical protein
MERVKLQFTSPQSRLFKASTVSFPSPQKPVKTDKSRANRRFKLKLNALVDKIYNLHEMSKPLSARCSIHEEKLQPLKPSGHLASSTTQPFKAEVKLITVNRDKHLSKSLQSHTTLKLEEVKPEEIQKV